MVQAGADSQDIQIRRASPSDAAAFAEIMAEADVAANLLQMPYANEQMWQERLKNAGSDGQQGLVLVAVRGGRVVGNASLHPGGGSPRRRHVMELGIAVSSSAQGSGVGSALMQALCEYADQWAHVLRMELTVFADNRRAIALYERFGFVHEGTHRAFAFKNGALADVVSMARLHPRQPLLNVPL